MLGNKRYDEASEFLQKNGLRFSRQRMIVISELFFNSENQRHFYISDLLEKINKDHQNIDMSLASLTHILKGLSFLGYIKQIYANKLYYDTVTSPHFHLYDENEDRLIDIIDTEKMDYLKKNLSLIPGYSLKGINCIFQIEKNS